MAQAEKQAVTVEDLMALGSDAHIEVVNGEIVEMPPVSLLHGFVVNNIYDLLSAYVRKHKLGYVFSDNVLFYLDADTVAVKSARAPDTSFVHKDRITPETDLSRGFPGAPDLAVEVMSPGDTASAVLSKARDYLEAGSAQVWVLYPDQKEVHQHVKDSDTVHISRAGGAFSVEDLFPGMTILVDDLFAVPDLGRGTS